MHRSRRRWMAVFFSVSVAAGLVATAWRAATRPEPRYTVRGIGLEFSDGTEAVDLDDQGRILFQILTYASGPSGAALDDEGNVVTAESVGIPGPWHAVSFAPDGAVLIRSMTGGQSWLWQPGKTGAKRLPHPVVGYGADGTMLADVPYASAASYILRNGRKTAITCPPGYQRARPVDANRAGTIVGIVSTSHGADRAFFWQDGTLRLLDLVSGCTQSWVHAINDSGQAIGIGLTDRWSTARVCLWENGRVRVLDRRGFRVRGLYPEDIDNNGRVVGTLARPDRFRLVPSRLFSGKIARPASLLDWRHITRAVMWEDGRRSDLNDLIPPNSGWTLDRAIRINDNGAILGTGTYRNQRRAFLLTPVEGR